MLHYRVDQSEEQSWKLAKSVVWKLQFNTSKMITSKYYFFHSRLFLQRASI